MSEHARPNPSARDDSAGERPSVLFVCVKNGGKSQMAAALARLRAGDRLDVYSAGTRPGTGLNGESRAAVEEVGASMEGEYTKPVDPELLRSADRVVILGTEARIENADRDIEVWETDEPSTRGIEGPERMRLIREDIDARVQALVHDLTGD